MEIKWDKTFGGSADDYLGSSAINCSTGNIILAGHSNSPVSGDKSEARLGSVSSYSDYWLVEITSSGDIVWNKRFGSDGNEQLSEMIITSDGNYILAGTSYSKTANGEKTQANRQDYWDMQNEDYWIVKVNSVTRTKMLDRRYGGYCKNIIANVSQCHELLQMVHQTTDGGFILGGYSDTNGDPFYVQFNVSDRASINDLGMQTYWLVKTTSAAAREWDMSYTVTGNVYNKPLRALLQTEDGGYLLGVRSDADYYLIKTAFDGSVEWETQYGGSDYDNIQILRKTSDGGYILGGLSFSGISGSKTESGKSWIVKTDASGNKMWDRAFGGNGVYDIRQTNDGGYIVCCQGSYMAVKISSAGVTDWTFSASGGGDDQFRSIHEVSDGYILAGYSNSAAAGGVKTAPNKGGYDYWVMKIGEVATPVTLISFSAQSRKNSAGEPYINLEWETGIEINTKEFVLLRSADGENFKTVSTLPAKGNSQILQTYAAEDFSPLPGISYYRLKIIDMDNAVSYSHRIEATLASSNSSKLANVYPNPSKNLSDISVTFEAEENKEISLTLFSASGQKVFEYRLGKMKAGQHSYLLEGKNLKPGLYFLRLNADNADDFRKVMIL